MSSSSIAELGMISNTAVAIRTLQSRAGVAAEDIEDTTMARVSPLHADTERTFAMADADVMPTSNVIELETPQLRRTNVALRAPAPRRAKINPSAVALVVRFVDVGAVAAAGVTAYLWQPSAHWPLDPTTALTALGIMAMIVRRPNTNPRVLSELLRRPLSRRLAEGLLRTLLPFVLSVLVVMTVMPVENIFRAPLTHWLTMWAMGAVGCACAVRIGLTGILSYWRSRGYMKERVAIFGTGELAERLLDRLQDSCADTVEVVGVFDDRARRRIVRPDLRSLSLGTADDLIALSQHRDIDRVLVALPHAAEQRVVEIVKKLRLMPIEISLAPDQAGFNLACKEHDDLSGLPLTEVHGRPLTFGEILIKGAVDKTLAAIALVLGAPLLLALAIAIKLDSRGPVFFRQNRHGFGDRVMGVYKFRTMTAEAAEPNGESQARQNDPRVTRIGRFLRCWSLDELPQLINVLRGEMSLVGPRPHAISMQVEERPNRDIVPDYAMRHHVKPGITGWAQINGYHGPVATEEGLRARVRYDIEYINNWSLWFDFQIMLLTVKTVLGQRHAY